MNQVPASDAQASQWSYYDLIIEAWKKEGLDKKVPLTQATIERLSKNISGEARGIPLDLWLYVIATVTAIKDANKPIAKLAFSLATRYKKPEGE